MGVAQVSYRRVSQPRGGGYTGAQPWQHHLVAVSSGTLCDPPPLSLVRRAMCPALSRNMNEIVHEDLAQQSCVSQRRPTYRISGEQECSHSRNDSNLNPAGPLSRCTNRISSKVAYGWKATQTASPLNRKENGEGLPPERLSHTVKDVWMLNRKPALRRGTSDRKGKSRTRSANKRCLKKSDR